MKQRGLIAFVFAIGCVAGGVGSQLVLSARAETPAGVGTGSAGAATPLKRWEHKCDSVSIGHLSAALKKAGADGWELAGLVAESSSGGAAVMTMQLIVCTKRPLP